ncbi:DUF4844 domain-containing protein [Lysobacter sp. 2RAF19]
MSEDSTTVQALRQIAGKDNFAGELGALYTGVQDPIARSELNSRFDHAVELLISAASAGAQTPEYLAIIEKQINGFDRDSLDTEDAEQVASNFEKVLDCLGIESSGDILNDWMYGFDIS